MNKDLDDIIETLEDTAILQPLNELEIYRKYIPHLRSQYKREIASKKVSKFGNCTVLGSCCCQIQQEDPSCFYYKE